MENFSRSCSPALQPSIGTVYLVPRQECFDDLKPIAFMEGAVVPTLKEKVIATQVGQEQSHPPRDPFSAIPVEVLPIIPDCPIGEKARTQIIDGVEVVSAASATFRVDSPEKCVHACMTSSYPDGSRLPLLCRSSQFVRKSFKCSVYPDALNPNGYLEYKPNPNVLYMEKLCISEEILPLSCDEIFRRIPQHVIIGHASEILTVSSEEECICECILAKVKRDIDCRSLLHYPEVQTSNCILNIHSRLTRSEYFMPELEYKVDYVQIPECARKAGGANLDSTVSNNREPLMSIDTRIVENDKDFGLPPGIGSVESEWSEWTTCDPKTSTHRRERLCTDCVEQIQIQPCFSNNNFDDILESFVTEQDKADLPGSQRLKPTKNKPSIDIIPFPISQMIAENNKTADIEYFGPPFKNLSPTWKSTFRRI
ncbi:hypothetical protein RB195_021491 [Necator americanus]|uniref:Apple domain-containing protein n=1 Tax=Necator americanus TaxID=51031 RepID=A0ABR1EBA5_NECAM